MSEEINWYDDCFQVVKAKWGTFHSEDKDGKKLVTSLHEEECVKATRFYLKGIQEGWPESKSYEGTVGGKL